MGYKRFESIYDFLDRFENSELSLYACLYIFIQNSEFLPTSKILVFPHLNDLGHEYTAADNRDLIGSKIIECLKIAEFLGYHYSFLSVQLDDVFDIFYEKEFSQLEKVDLIVNRFSNSPTLFGLCSVSKRISHFAKAH